MTSLSSKKNNENFGLSSHQKYLTVRNLSTDIAKPLSAEDQQVQSMPDVSPTKWHLGHTTWFFETFLLKQHFPKYQEFSADFGFAFNSYYELVGPRQLRAERGLITRPAIDEVLSYRKYVDDYMGKLLSETEPTTLENLKYLIELGLNHEEQHQELALIDIKHVFSRNPISPAYQHSKPALIASTHKTEWFSIRGGEYKLGHSDENCFAFDNEGPEHKVLVSDFQIASRCVTNREYLEFIGDNGYKRPEFWHSDGWDMLIKENITCPFFWFLDENKNWGEFTLSGNISLNLDAPVCHISYYEASAFAAWAGKRLPTETEWEIAAKKFKTNKDSEVSYNELNSGNLSPVPSGELKSNLGPVGMFGDVWEWTSSPYIPYPGFKVAPGAVGEYNGKFMVNQMVLRGSSCVTPAGHSRITYRNFFYPHQRWMFSGLRLAH